MESLGSLRTASRVSDLASRDGFAALDPALREPTRRLVASRPAKNVGGIPRPNLQKVVDVTTDLPGTRPFFQTKDSEGLQAILSIILDSHVDSIPSLPVRPHHGSIPADGRSALHPHPPGRRPPAVTDLLERRLHPLHHPPSSSRTTITMRSTKILSTQPHDAYHPIATQRGTNLGMTAPT